MMQRIVNTTRAFAYVASFSHFWGNPNPNYVGEIALIANLTDVEIFAGDESKQNERLLNK
jgi:hypothetical protein